ncbi:MAG: hypothetical protein RLZZ28_323 [Bacteroidota bacterium]|jgi:gamma-glutamylcyclotransferase (GGCT)/AIG2-like uncharacterized protein YtfP
MQQLFSYGTLQKEKVQLESFGRLLVGQKDFLPGFRIALLEITNKDVLAKSEQAFHPIATQTDNPADCIEGMVFEITEQELLAADEYEVAQYQRIAVRLKSGLEAWVYVEKH